MTSNIYYGLSLSERSALFAAMLALTTLSAKWRGRARAARGEGPFVTAFNASR